MGKTTSNTVSQWQTLAVVAIVTIVLAGVSLTLTVVGNQLINGTLAAQEFVVTDIVGDGSLAVVAYQDGKPYRDRSGQPRLVDVSESTQPGDTATVPQENAGVIAVVVGMFGMALAIVLGFAGVDDAKKIRESARRESARTVSSPAPA